MFSKLFQRFKNEKKMSILGEKTGVRGNFYFEYLAHIDGEVHGEVLGSGVLVVGRNGYVHGDILATEVIIEGRVDGNVSAHSKVEIRSRGQLYGNIMSGQPHIEDGAIFAGHCLTDVSLLSDGAASAPGKNFF